MNIKKALIFILLLSWTKLIASDINSINILIEKINNSNSSEIKNQLIMKLSKQLKKLNKKDLKVAQTIVNGKLAVIN